MTPSRVMLAFLALLAHVALTTGMFDFDSLDLLALPPPPPSPPPPPVHEDSSPSSSLRRPRTAIGFGTGTLNRKDVESLTETEVLALQTSLRHLEDDHTATGYQQAVAAYHGEPSMCTDKNNKPVACCIHGMATFPQWHRLYVVQFEQALVQHGLANIGVPFWDWTKPLSELPELVQHQIFRDPNGGLGQKNAWYSGEIDIGDLHTHTARAIDERLFKHVKPGEHTPLFDIVLDALEMDDYCQFVTQFEVAHNHIHYLVGGRHKYSMSSLEYTSYDPIFFLHHSNVDRLFVIWQELQKKRGKPYDHADCSVELFRQKMQPFDRDTNPFDLTRSFSTAKDLFSHLQLNYAYDDLTLNGMNVDELHAYLEQRHARERAFAAFSLHGYYFSANVRVKVCEDEDVADDFEHHDYHHCEFAGDFFILGGENEMAWEFHHPFYFDVSDAVLKLGQPLDGRFHVVADVYSINGTFLGHDVLPRPYASHRLPRGHHDPPIGDGRNKKTVSRKDVSLLTPEEMYALRQAMSKFQNDTSVDGYQAIAEFHGLPAKCPHPDAAVRYACCIHGMATFPHWHRLFVVEVEDELRSRGLEIGIPYWDWTRPNAAIPALAADATYVDPLDGHVAPNPFYDSLVAFRGERTSRQVQTGELSQNPAFGEHTSLFEGMLYAFEQTDFCDFEIHFEVVHNAPHFLVGGFAPYSLATLHYSAFDPIFYLHHSNVDRMWAIWQKLQILRGLPYKAHCAGSLTQEVLKPFGFPPPFNNDEKTLKHARPTKVYDYEKELEYTYDTLTFGGMTVEQLQHYLEERQTRDRDFVGIQLHHIGVSAWVKVSITPPAGGAAFEVGTIAVLGGEKEMHWRFDRLFKLEITDALKDHGLAYDDAFEVHLDITDVNGNKVSEDEFSHSTIIHEPGKVHHEDGIHGDEHYLRSDVATMSREQIQNLRTAMQSLQDDASTSGFHQIAAFHGQPNWCPAPDAEKKFACCAHGMAIFPHWHRLHTVQMENALHEHGFRDGLPYWDWTLPMTSLPDIVTPETYVHPESGATLHNPLHDVTVDGHKTTRNVRDSLFEAPAFGKMTKIAEQVFLAFEQTDFCDFEVHFEIAHNYIHALVGGNDMYSMASLRYTAFDPLFFLHHSNTDRLWATWQALQKYRGMPHKTANCAIAQLRQPLQPFAQSDVTNPDPVTRAHAGPSDVFKYEESFHYSYDNFQFNGLSIPMIQREIVKRQHEERVFAGFMLHGVGQSVLVVLDICTADDACATAGEFYLLGDEFETPWSYDRLFKFEISHQLEELELKPLDRYHVSYTVYQLDGTSLGHDLFGNATVIHTGGHHEGMEYIHDLLASSHVRRNLDDLTVGEMESLRSALLAMEEDGSFQAIAKFHGYPGLCDDNGRAAACCVHGSPVFPHWHRLYVEQVENALLAHGSAVSVPYWDWTQPIRKLPELIDHPTYYNSRTYTQDINPFFRAQISGLDNVYTTRDPRPELFNSDYMLENVLLALEQTSFCDFEVHFEMVHNSMHSMLGGRGKYSMSGLDYSAFDPAFILHHSNTDRIWAIWQALQKHRGLNFEESDCALNLMRQPLHPFDTPDNTFDLTHKYSRPVDVFDYSGNLDYQYDNLKFNSWTIPQLEKVLEQQRKRDRLFAGFLLHNIGTSADVEIDVCVATSGGGRDCDHPAGSFSILGGEYEMAFTFDRLYKFDISDTVRKLGLKLDNTAEFELELKVKAANGSYIDSSLLNPPSIIFQPGEDKVQDDHGHTHKRLIRKDVRTLSPEEHRSLVVAMRTLQADNSADGFQSLASFHAMPPLCPNPEAKKRYACCIHGMATFPAWHRLYTVQFEDALRRHGALVGIPYFDTLQPNDQLPGFLADATYHDPINDKDSPNPWAGAEIEFDHHHVERDVQLEELARKGPHGYDTWSWKQYIYALEQEDYCDFEVEFEMAHNAIHAWLGGNTTYGMGHLHYASYDPAFLLHHSNTDRIFAVWQKLQEYRGKNPNEINCALEMMREPLKPFSFGSPYNLNPKTKEYSRPEDTLDYMAHFQYEYDKLEMQGLDVARLNDYINEQKEHDRVFAGFLLHGIGQSAHVHFTVCPEGGACVDAGDFDILGGSAEMPWNFDRLYKYEITDVLHANNMDVRDPFHIEVAVTCPQGHALTVDFPEPSILYEPKSRSAELHTVAPNRVRHDLSHLNKRDQMSLKAALLSLKQDDGVDGWQNIASFHGAPARCPSPAAPTYACCIHGMPTFPHWHRLFVVEVEDALIRHGSSVAVPYWDWMRPIDHLPDLFTSESYYDAWRDEVIPNPFARGYIKDVGGFTVREPQPALTKRSRDGNHSVLYDEVLLALEQTDYCDFVVQYEVTHNAIHYLVGGRQKYSLSTLEYSSYDPIFFVHHAFMDKVWVMWQELQKHRGLPHDRADCAINYMSEKMHPYDWPELNQDVRTREHAVPQTVFDYEDLGYHYDDMTLGGQSLEELEEEIHRRQSQPRVMAGFHLHAVGTSGDVVFHVCRHDGDCFRAGAFFILGGPLEMPWTFDRAYKYDITDALREAQISPEDVFNTELPFTLQYEVHAVNGSALPASVIHKPTIIFEPAHGAAADQTSYSLAGRGVRKDIRTLTAAETKSLRDALQKVKDGNSPISYEDLASWHGYPGLCEQHGHKVACCHHGMASFPQWHRLYVRQLEMLMTFVGAEVGIPYWDWTYAFTELPALVTEADNNPFHHGTIDKDHFHPPSKDHDHHDDHHGDDHGHDDHHDDDHHTHVTSRAPRPQLFVDPEHGTESFFYRQVLLALEQRDYCDFEVHYEVAHNAIHSWIGGRSQYGMSTLEYSAFDPIFFLHHSNVDRQFAIWQALQKHRGLDYNTANCNIQELRMPLEPFNRESNPIKVIREHARAIDAFDYDVFNYQYDHLNFHGMTIAELDELLEKKRHEDHVYANFLLHGIGASADVRFELCDHEDHCQFAGTFAILGGPLEMPWRFDRLFKYDVTNVFRQMHLRPDSLYHFNVQLTAINGTELSSSLLEPPSVSFVPGKRNGKHAVAHEDPTPTKSEDVTRHEVSEMSLEEVSNLRNALYKLQNDNGPNGFQAIASFHGYPGLCPEDADEKIACCKHGMPAFPHWHRLLTVQFERALRDKGARVGVPYWDWTRATKSLPSLFTDTVNNPFNSFHMSDGHDIVRDVQSRLFSHPSENDVESLFHQALDTLAEDNYCDFEVHYEMLHNTLHALVGGGEKYSMATLEYSAFDPFFMVHHASIDRLWTMWQELQKLRHKPFNFATCAGRSLFAPLEPFNYESLNTDLVTRANSQPVQVFDASKFHYNYDHLDLNGHSVSELHTMLEKQWSSDRVYAGFLLHGLGTSATVHVDVLAANGTEIHAGYFYVLGGEGEMPWAYERPYKLDITQAVAKAGLGHDDTITLRTSITTYDGKSRDDKIPYVIIERHGNSDHDVLVINIGPGFVNAKKVTVKRGTHIRFHSTDPVVAASLKELGSYTSMLLCAIPPGTAGSYKMDVDYPMKPGHYFFSDPNPDGCKQGHQIMVSVDRD